MIQNATLSVADLKARGWTDSTIRKFLGEPDDCCRVGRFHVLKHLYDAGRVATAEETMAFKTAKAQSNHMSARTLAIVATKQKKLNDWIDALDIEIADFPDDELTSIACVYYNALWSERGKAKHASPDDSSQFLARITVNFLRHECSSYERLLNQMAGKVGVADARGRLKHKILDAIGDAYPELYEECARQQNVELMND